MDQYDEHQLLCKGTVVEYTVQATLLQSHVERYRLENLNHLLKRKLVVQNETDDIHATEQRSIQQNVIITGIQQHLEQVSKLPTANLPGIQAVFGARSHNWLYHIWIMFGLNLEDLISILITYLTLPFL